MDAQQITQDETGVWQIITVTHQHILLSLPPDGRASITVLATFRDLAEAANGSVELASSELVTWGSYGVVAGMGAGIKVGRSAVLVLEPLTRSGIASVIFTAPIERIEHLR
jgi:hypothetical protein